MTLHHLTWRAGMRALRMSWVATMGGRPFLVAEMSRIGNAACIVFAYPLVRRSGAKEEPVAPPMLKLRRTWRRALREVRCVET